MATVTTTLALACGLSDTRIKVTSATGFAVGQYLYVETETLLQTGPASGVWIPVRRGVEGSAQVAHAAAATVTTRSGIDQTSSPVAAGDLVLPGTAKLYFGGSGVRDARLEKTPSWPEIHILTGSGADEASLYVYSGYLHDLQADLVNAFTAAYVKEIRPADGNLTIAAGSDKIVITGLPTSDPAVPGALWNSAGTVKISL